jgi:hypothetical protein
MLKHVVPLALFALVSCAHNESNHSVSDSLRDLGRDIGKLVERTRERTNTPAEDPASVHARVHTEVVPLRERLEKIRERTNTNMAAKDADKRDPSRKEVEDRAKIEAELNQMEDQLNKIDQPQEAPPPAAP